MLWIADLVVVVALIVAYTVLTVTGHDANGVLGLLAGYLSKIGVNAVASSSSSSRSSG